MCNLEGSGSDLLFFVGYVYGESIHPAWPNDTHGLLQAVEAGENATRERRGHLLGVN